MTRIEDIESRIRELNAEELSAFRRWFSEFDSHLWDAQIERDVNHGKLESLADEALTDHKNRRSTVL